MKNYRDALKVEMSDPEFKKEWNALDKEFRLIRQTLKSEQPKIFSPPMRERAKFENFSVAQ